MLNISVVILTYNEEIHISRCIKSVQKIAKDVFIIDSFSTDKTIEIAESLAAKIFQNKWENNHAKQFNWGLDNLPINTKWVLRLDADEYLLPELVDELIENLNKLPEDVTGIEFKRKLIFMDKWIKCGTYPKLLRLFRYKKAICENRWMDEHIQLLEGRSVEFKNDFADHNLNNLAWWIEKHNNYSIRAAIELLNVEFELFSNNNSKIQLGEEAAMKRRNKIRYGKLPLFWRSFAYFIYRYFLKLGFTEGRKGFLWHFLQGWWYHTLIDAKIYEVKKICGSDKIKIIKYLENEYGFELLKIHQLSEQDLTITKKL